MKDWVPTVLSEGSCVRSCARAPVKLTLETCPTCHGLGQVPRLCEDEGLRALIAQIEEAKPFVPDNRAGRRAVGRRSR